MNTKQLGILMSLMLVLAGAVLAQDGQTDSIAPRPQQERRDLLREIGLSPEQMRQMRRINMERKPLMQEAQLRLRNANRQLDEAIYADQVSETNVQARLKEAQAAQAEVFRIRSTSELAIRKILTPDQLVKFRELRRRFEEQIRQNVQRRKQNSMDSAIDTGAGTRQRGRRRQRPMIAPTPLQKQP